MVSVAQEGDFCRSLSNVSASFADLLDQLLWVANLVWTGIDVHGTAAGLTGCAGTVPDLAD